MNLLPRSNLQSPPTTFARQKNRGSSWGTFCLEEEART
jgi:hypothetical protein